MLYAILILLVLVFAGLYLRTRANNYELCRDQNREIDSINAAWAKGQDEIVEAANADLADQVDKVEALKKLYDEATEEVVNKMRENALVLERLTECQHIIEMQKECIEIIDEEKASMLSTLVMHQTKCLPTLEEGLTPEPPC